MTKEKVLIVDDEPSMGEFLELVLQKEGYKVRVVKSAEEALSALEEEAFNLIISDLRMPGMTGIDLIRESKTKFPDLGFVIMTAFASLESAVEALRLGAADYITKPFQVDEIKVVIEKVLDGIQLKKENKRLKIKLGSPTDEPVVIGSSEATRDMIELVKRVAPSESTILITGESGTGKELVAQCLHYYSDRSRGEFVSINCAAVPDTLLESELFGHTKGSFTGAVKDKEGLFKIASGGTLFLDEIGDMTPTLQVKLLRALQEREILPLGATKPIKVDARVVAATNADLDKKQKSGEFRLDLYYRLSVIPIHIKPLRERKEDILELAEFFMNRICARHGISIKTLSADVKRMFHNYAWPGNVRELENTIERVVVLTESQQVELSSLPSKIVSSEGSSFGNSDNSYSGTLEELERGYLLKVLEETRWQKKRASEILGIDPSTIYRKLQRYGIDPPK